MRPAKANRMRKISVNGEVMKFQRKLVGDGEAELSILDTPVRIKPIHCRRK